MPPPWAPHEHKAVPATGGGDQDPRGIQGVLELGGAAGLLGRLPVMAGPFASEEVPGLVPRDKMLRPEWVASLTARGEREVRRGPELTRIGMPVGGLCAGTLYLGGDGRPWLWDVLNRVEAGTGIRGHGNNGELYVKPLEPTSPMEHGFALRLDGAAARPLDATGFAEVEFVGEYPIGEARYRDPACPVAVDLEAFSPFVPLDFDRSSYPATLFRVTVTNTSAMAVAGSLFGWLGNPVGLHTGVPGLVTRHNRAHPLAGGFALTCSARTTEPDAGARRPDIVFEDFEGDAYDGWEVEGAAFGSGPCRRQDIPEYQTIARVHGERLANSHASAPGTEIGAKDDATGRLLSWPFAIERRFIRFLIGGGRNPGETCLNLLVDGEVTRSETGWNNNELRPAFFDVHDLVGREARIEIVDRKSGAWGNIGVDWIVFSDEPTEEPYDLDTQPDTGTMTLVAFDPAARGAAHCRPAEPTGLSSEPSEADFAFGGDDEPTGAVEVPLNLQPGESRTVTFAIAWHFPNLSVPGLGAVGRYYAARFRSADDVVRALAREGETLVATTRLWHRTWYADSTLPYWFLSRTLLNTSILATETAFRFRNGRFYGNEGVGCCPGTCAHVWHYAHAIGRLFPVLERDLRERVDLELAMAADGAIHCRAEFGGGDAVDGEAGVVLRCYREHQMSPDDAFLRRNWAGIEKALRHLIALDGNDDGILEGHQENTLDAAWYGKIPWLSGLYCAALRAGAAMATELGEESFAAEMARIADAGRDNLEALFDGEYYIQELDPAHLDAIGTADGCHIDQVLGPSWAYQVGLGEVMRRESVRKALASLWTYNFCPDVGPYRAVHTQGRPYALAGDAGLLMCTWPKGGPPSQWAANAWQYGYFNECMSGFEHQVAGHMLWEGMLTEGLAIERAIHDRYHPLLRNPYNEIECGDHYSRAMASYGVFLAACGFECHGPKGHLGFAPRIRPEEFSAAFTAAEGWGRIGQTRVGATQTETIEVRWGRLRVRTLAFEVEATGAAPKASVRLGDREIGAETAVDGTRVAVALAEEVTVEAGATLEVVLA